MSWRTFPARGDEERARRGRKRGGLPEKVFVTSQSVRRDQAVGSLLGERSAYHATKGASLAVKSCKLVERGGGRALSPAFRLFKSLSNDICIHEIRMRSGKPSARPGACAASLEKSVKDTGQHAEPAWRIAAPTLG